MRVPRMRMTDVCHDEDEDDAGVLIASMPVMVMMVSVLVRMVGVAVTCL